MMIKDQQERKVRAIQPDLSCGRKRSVRFAHQNKKRIPDTNYNNFSLINVCKCNVSFPSRSCHTCLLLPFTQTTDDEGRRREKMKRKEDCGEFT
jgi:hypothetical protein